jgi:hypothetical protein
LSDDRLQSKKTSRFWWLPDRLLYDVTVRVLAGLILLVLAKIASKAMKALRGIKMRPILGQFGRAFWRASPVLTFVFGFIFQKNVLAFAGLLTPPRIIGVIGAFAVAGVYFHFWAKQHLRSFQDITHAVGNRSWNLVLGGLSKAFSDLAVGLLPFWQNPWIFVVLGLYFALILDVVWMKKWFGRAVRLTSQPSADGASHVRYGL